MALFDHPPYRPGNLIRTLRAQVPRKAARDMLNRLRFGPEAPLSDEGLSVPLAEITHIYAPGHTPAGQRFRRRHSGLVKGGDWDLSAKLYTPGRIERAIHARLKDGADWEETELWAHGLSRIREVGFFDECRSEADMRARYDRLDRIAREVAQTGRLRSEAEAGSYFRREHGGIFCHIGRAGQPIRAGGGQHRFALARVLGIKDIPVQLGVTHLEALRAGALARYRRS